MGRRGPQPQPTALKLERGNPGHRPLNQDEPELAPASTTKPPTGMGGRARREWIRLADELISKGVLTVGDMYAFEEYCRLVGEVDSYQKLIKRVDRPTPRSPDDTDKAAPAAPAVLRESHRLGYANYLLKLRAQLRQQAAHLGLTPSSRSGVKVVRSTANAVDAKRDRFFGKRKAKPA